MPITLLCKSTLEISATPSHFEVIPHCFMCTVRVFSWGDKPSYSPICNVVCVTVTGSCMFACLVLLVWFCCLFVLIWTSLYFPFLFLWRHFRRNLHCRMLISSLTPCPTLLFYWCDKILMKISFRMKGLFCARSYSPSCRRNQGQDRDMEVRQEWKQRPWKSTLDWLAFQGLQSLLFRQPRVYKDS